MKNLKMLYLLLSIVVLLLTADTSLAVEITVPDKRNTVTVKQICVNGYSFVIIVSPEGAHMMRGVSIVQLYIEGQNTHRPPQPKRCIIKEVPMKGSSI